MDWKVLLILFISEYVRESNTNTPCTGIRCLAGGAVRKRHAKAFFRYRPQFSKCRIPSECGLVHKYLFLVTGSAYENLLRDCSFTVYVHNARDLNDLLSERASVDAAAIIIVHTVYRRKSLYSQLVNAMVSRLGNLSLYSDDPGTYRDLSDVCDSSERCVNLMTLIPVIEQNKRWNAGTHALSSTALDLYDPRWLPTHKSIPSLDSTNVYRYTSSVDLQLELLAAVLCARNRRHNLFYEVAPSLVHEETTVDEPTTADDHGSDLEQPAPLETRLELLDILPIDPKKYDKNKPPKNKNQPTIVDFHVTVLSLDSINEESMTYVADIFLAQSWRDQRLRLPESMDHYRILDVDWLHDIWKPDSFFKNAKHVTFHEISVPNHYLWLYHDKTLLYMSKLSLVLSCAMKFESYPHDTQVCSMMIESLSHTTHDLIFRWNSTDPLVVSSEIELPQLDIARNFTADCTIEYSTGNFTCLAVVFSLRRRLGYHLFHTYIPSALIVVMSWISFWIKPEAIPARVTLGVTSLLTLATQNTQSQQSLPPVSYVKAVDIWMSSCSIFVFLSLMEFAIVNNYMGPVATKVMKGYSEEDMQVEDDVKGLQNLDGAASGGLPAGPQYITFCHGKAVALCIDKFSRLFFPFSFIVLNILYWTSFL